MCVYLLCQIYGDRFTRNPLQLFVADTLFGVLMATRSSQRDKPPDTLSGVATVNLRPFQLVIKRLPFVFYEFFRFGIKKEENLARSLCHHNQFSILHGFINCEIVRKSRLILKIN